MNTPRTYSALEWQAHETFVQLITDICHQKGISLTWLSDDWIAVLKRGDKHCYLQGYLFPLNNATAAAIVRDKVATYEVLHHHNVPAITHSLVRLPDDREIPHDAASILQLCPLPAVLKPNSGQSGGTDVYKCETEAELLTAFDTLAHRYQSIAISPYTDITAEYRVLLLDDRPKVVFEKIRQPGQWQHNLKFGSTPKLITDNALLDILVPFARRALQAIGGRLAAVDIVSTPQGYKVLEVNGGVTLNFFSSESQRNRDQARAIYGDLIDASLQA